MVSISFLGNLHYKGVMNEPSFGACFFDRQLFVDAVIRWMQQILSVTCISKKLFLWTLVES